MNGQGIGQGAILDTSYRLVDSSNPASAGSAILQIYCTGLGAVTYQPPSGSPPGGQLSQTTTTPTVTIGGVQAQVLFSGLAPGPWASTRWMRSSQPVRRKAPQWPS
jgi:uncharacterized protein (TIGR03437 family)